MAQIELHLRGKTQSLLINSILFQGPKGDFPVLLPEDIIVHIAVMLAVNLQWQWRPAQVVKFMLLSIVAPQAKNY